MHKSCCSRPSNSRPESVVLKILDDGSGPNKLEWENLTTALGLFNKTKIFFFSISIQSLGLGADTCRVFSGAALEGYSMFVQTKRREILSNLASDPSLR